MTTRTIAALLFAVAGAARAGDICSDEPIDSGSNQQGPFLTGQGLTGCSFTSSADLSVATNLKLHGSCKVCATVMEPNVTLTSCAHHTSNNKLWMCSATADRKLCADVRAGYQGVDAGEPFQLLAIEGSYEINGKPTVSQGVASKTYTFACGGTGAVLTHASAIYKCSHGLFEIDSSSDNPDLYWRFIPGSPEFNTCVRAARADYCGTGMSHTSSGTRIVLLSACESAQSSCGNGMCDEAGWNENGATYIAHPRWQNNDAVNDANNSLSSPTITDCQRNWQRGNGEGISTNRKNTGPTLFKTRSKLHWPLNGTPACSLEVEGTPTNHSGNDCSADCTTALAAAGCRP